MPLNLQADNEGSSRTIASRTTQEGGGKKKESVATGSKAQSHVLKVHSRTHECDKEAQEAHTTKVSGAAGRPLSFEEHLLHTSLKEARTSLSYMRGARRQKLYPIS